MKTFAEMSEEERVELVTAAVKGEKIQFYPNVTGKWGDCTKLTKGGGLEMFFPDIAYRIKPKEIQVVGRLYLDALGRGSTPVNVTLVNGEITNLKVKK